MSGRSVGLLLIAAMLPAFCTAIPQESPVESWPRPLTVTSTREVTVPPFPYFQYPVSDNNHNLYFHYDTGRFDAPVLLRLSSSQAAAIIYKLSPEDSEIFLYGSSSVTPSGEVWMACSKEEKGSYLFTFNSDAKPERPTQLQVQDGFLPRTLVAFPGGTFLVSGYFGHGASKPLQGRSFLGVFNTTGKLIKELRGILDKTDVTAEIVRPADSYAVIGSDGNAYFLSSARISVVSPAGVIVRTIRFNMVEGSRATRIFESSTNLVVQTTTLKSNGVHQNRYLLIDGTTGKSIVVYEPSPELGNVAVDFSRNEGLTFIKRDRSTLKLLTAVLK